jgi:hypothetical protein
MNNPLVADLVRALNPAALAGAIGMAPDPWQTDVLRSQHPRILLNCCRQSGKSTTAAVLAIWTAIYEPGSVVLVLSPSMRQSGELFRKALGLYRSMGRPVAAEAESALTLTLENRSRLVCLPGQEGTVRGYSGVRLLVVDEASRVDDELLAAIRPMMAVSAGRLIALSTPAGKRGWWYEAWESGGPDWLRVLITADQVPRISADFLEEERAALGEFLFRQEYYGRFAETSEQLFGAEAVAGAFDRTIEPLTIGGI